MKLLKYSLLFICLWANLYLYCFKDTQTQPSTENNETVKNFATYLQIHPELAQAAGNIFNQHSMSVSSDQKTSAPLSKKENSDYQKIEGPPPGFAIDPKTGMLAPLAQIVAEQNQEAPLYQPIHEIPQGFSINPTTGALTQTVAFHEDDSPPVYQQTNEAPEEMNPINPNPPHDESIPQSEYQQVSAPPNRI